MKVSYEGIGALYATFSCGALTEGVPVRVSAAGSVSACSKGNEIAGVAAAVSRGKDACSVQLRGFVTLPYSGETAPTVGYCALAADGKGAVAKAATGGRSLLAVSVENGTVTVLL